MKECMLPTSIANKCLILVTLAFLCFEMATMEPVVCTKYLLINEFLKML